MAKNDYSVAERAEWQDGPVTALGRVNETVSETPDAANRAEADATGLKDAAYIDYDVALDLHQSREDIETLQSKQTRNAPADFAAAEYMRELPNRSGGNGYAPDPDNDFVGEVGTSSGA